MTDARPEDALSVVFEQVEVRGMMTGGFAVRGPWASSVAVFRPLKLIALVAGSARLRADGPGGPDGPIDLVTGDVVLLNHRTRLEVEGGPRFHEQSGRPDRGEGRPGQQDARADQAGERVARPDPEAAFDPLALAAADLSTDDVLVGGWISVNPAGQALFTAALPSLVHVRATAPSAARLAGLVEQLFSEAAHPRLGSTFAVRQTGQLILLEVLRAYLEQEQPPVGWLRLLADEPLAAAVQLMHQHPERPWGLAELARAANMSRTSFTERFRTLAGTSPLAYLTHWRMVLAQRALRDPDIRIGSLAARLGYGSESAFSTAFKREVGESPLQYRRGLLEPD